MLNAFTVDVEDYFQVNAFADRIRPRDWDDYPSRVVPNTRRILDLLERHQVRGTFFILGWVADRHPELVREIHMAGHEIGCHSFWHQLIYNMTPESFREDLVMATKAISEITGEPVQAFRAPCFSVTEDSLWALEILAEEGYRYDSSVFPVHHDTYGLPHADRYPYFVETGHGSLLEFPPSVYTVWRWHLPVAGGGYFRLYPGPMSRFCLGRVNRGDQQPFMFYIHPWEVDPDQPRLPAGWKSRFRHYQNLKTTEKKLDSLLRRFSCGAMSDVLGDRKDAPLPPTHTVDSLSAAGTA